MENIDLKKGIVWFLLILSACSSQNTRTSDEAFTLSLRLHLGLDCGMIFDCGYRIDLGEDKVLRYFDEPNDTLASLTANISKADTDEIAEILDRFDFFGSDFDWTYQEESLLYGSTRISYQSEDSSEIRIKTIPFEGDTIPEQVVSFRLELDRFLRTRLNLD